MKALLRFYFSLILIALVQNVNAQKTQLDFNLVTGTNGITLGKVNAITQDKFGYMWFVDNGNGCLVRFDGYRMKVFRHDPKDSNSYDATHGGECIAADSIGNVWVPADRGVDKFDYRTGIFIHFRVDTNDRCALKSGIVKILVDHSGLVWLGTNDGLYCLNQKTGKFNCYSNIPGDPTSLSCNIVRALYEDHEGTLWLGTGLEFNTAKEGGLNKFNRATGTFTRYMHDPNNPHSLINDKVRAIFEDSKGVFWVGTQGDGLHTMDRKTGLFERHTYNPSHPEMLSRPPVKKGIDHIAFITEDMTGAIWIGTYLEGLVLYNPDTKEIVHFKNDKLTPKGFTDSTSWCAYTSRDGALWISTDQETNLFRIDPLQTSFSNIYLKGSSRCFFEDSVGILWAGIEDNGLARINRSRPGEPSVVYYPVSPQGISYLGISSICSAEKGMLCLATVKGVYLFDPKTGLYSKAPYTDKKTGGDIGAFSVLNDNNGKELYIGGGSGFFVVDVQTGLVREYRNDPQDSTSISSDIIITTKQDRSGNIWIGTKNGLNLFDKKSNKFTHYLAGIRVLSVYPDTEGTVWAGTEAGLYFRKKGSTIFLPFVSEESEFRGAFINGLLEDGEKNIWGSSSLGIFRINPLKNELCIYGKKFGITNATATGVHNPLRAANGELIFANLNGYWSFYPKQVINNTPAKILFTGFKIDGHPVKPGKDGPLTGRIEEATEIKLNYNQNIFSIDFAALHYIDPENNILQYMLEGYENAWRNVSQEKTAYYFNVPSARYVFRIKASSSYGIPSEKSMKIIVLPPWWQTWWAYTLYALLLAFLIWGFIKWRTRALQKEKDLLENKVALRTKELKEEKDIVESTLVELKSTQAQLIQSEKMASLGELTAGIAHEIQNPLNFVNNFSELSNELIDEMKDELTNGNNEEAIAVADDIKQNLVKINHHGKRAGDIVKGMLQHSRISTGIKEPTDINALCDEYLRLSYHGLRAKDKTFNATMKTDFDSSIGKINIITQDIGRVILNLINNAFYAVNEKFKLYGTAAVTEKRKLNMESYEPTVSVLTKKIGNIVEISIKDNGNGIPEKIIDKIFQPFYTTKPAGQGTGLGLSLSYDIIKAHGGTIEVISNYCPPSGSKTVNTYYREPGSTNTILNYREPEEISERSYRKINTDEGEGLRDSNRDGQAGTTFVIQLPL